ncbi:hypothetical protein P5673_018233 [Acropora cervicornis]|uniref:Uncharacterized protein n=1 Tax=Acropora cervicornis TaxID=6130 RepID=A0AAD9QDW8_ACRCE|nr:hypothetical protein P5673_018233 [Acropora cervicornis]
MRNQGPFSRYLLLTYKGLARTHVLSPPQSYAVPFSAGDLITLGYNTQSNIGSLQRHKVFVPSSETRFHLWPKNFSREHYYADGSYKLVDILKLLCTIYTYRKPLKKKSHRCGLTTTLSLHSEMIILEKKETHFSSFELIKTRKELFAGNIKNRSFICNLFDSVIRISANNFVFNFHCILFVRCTFYENSSRITFSISVECLQRFSSTSSAKTDSHDNQVWQNHKNPFLYPDATK